MGSLDEWCSARELWWWDFCDASKLGDGNYSKHSLQAACVALTRSVVPIGIITMTTVVKSFHSVISLAFIRCDWHLVVRCGRVFPLYVDVNDALAKSWCVTCQLHVFCIFLVLINHIWYFIKMINDDISEVRWFSSKSHSCDKYKFADFPRWMHEMLCQWQTTRAKLSVLNFCWILMLKLAFALCLKYGKLYTVSYYWIWITSFAQDHCT